EKAAVARWVGRVLSAGDLRGPDSGWAEALDEAGVHGDLRRSVIEPFLAGVLGEVDGTTSRRFVDLVVRSFLRETPGLPTGGVQAVPEALAAQLRPGSVVLGTQVRHLGLAPRSLVAETTAGGVNVRAVVVATDAGAATHLVPRVEVPDSHALSAFWYVTPSSPAPASRERLLHLDGERDGPVVNTAVVSAVAPSYVPAGDRRGLVAALLLGRDTSAQTEARVRAQLGRVYGASTSGWELIAVHELPHALPVLEPPFDGPRPVEVGDGIFVTGDHRENPSQQGALVAGRRAADGVLTHLGMGRRRAG
ncbi:FAD-dependent oxidoreductase, partial [Kineococcus indalonis]|uniref:FAD-dependent oxidoreductase n=1 Tax=Kineococcus indalonis TaxID=2696566 RepID=UPI0014122448